MELRYTFDLAQFHLGTLCKRGHKWPGTDCSLRRTMLDSRGRDCSSCVGCTGRKQSSWLISFIDAQAMGLPEGWSFGKLCKGEHRWNGHDMSLKNNWGKCPECKKLRSKKQPRKSSRRWIPELTGLPPGERRKLYKRIVRERLRQQGLTTKGTFPTRANGAVPREQSSQLGAYFKAIKNAGRLPSVARLVMNEQRRYWRENPEAKRNHDRQWDRASWWLEYQTNPELRLYIRQKSKRRKAQMRNSVAIQVSGKQVRARFQQFDNRCAYCGGDGEPHIEHVVPISKGGTHALGNIVPACSDCNYSKTTHEVESWYRQQPFFSELRWRKICRVLGWNRSAVGQLALL